VAELRASLVALQARAAAMGVDAHAEDATQQQQQQQQQQQLVAQSPQTPSSSKRLLSMPRSSSFTRASVIAPRVVTVEEAMRDVAGRGECVCVCARVSTAALRRRALTLASPRDAVFKAGWVEKEGFNVRSWRRRFFVLYADRIDYYEDVRQSPKGSIQLETCAISGLKTHAGTSRPCLELTMEKRKCEFRRRERRRPRNAHVHTPPRRALCFGLAARERGVAQRDQQPHPHSLLCEALRARALAPARLARRFLESLCARRGRERWNIAAR
jgi:hypothetical protein